jgi:hypothetical protein
MTKHEAVRLFKPFDKPCKTATWTWDDDIVPPDVALECAGYVTGRSCFKAFAVINNLPIFLGGYPDRRLAALAIIEAHHGSQ